MLVCREKSGPELFLSKVPQSKKPLVAFLEQSEMVCKWLSAELKLLEKITEDLVSISTWQVINLRQPWEEEEKAVEGALRLSWHKFQSHIMWQVSWQD